MKVKQERYYIFMAPSKIPTISTSMGLIYLLTANEINSGQGMTLHC
jgi:hypothetical protein